jgi:hypothetical protein
MSAALPAAGDVTRMFVVGGAALAVTATLIVAWQRITPRSVIAAIRGS